MATDAFVGTVPGGVGVGQPTDQPTSPTGQPRVVLQPSVYAPEVAPQGAVTIPAVQAVEVVTANPFVRGVLTGVIVGAVAVGALWWITR